MLLILVLSRLKQKDGELGVIPDYIATPHLQTK